jgi:flagellar hook-associated protein 2
MVSQLQQYIDTMLARNNDIDNVIDRYNSDISDYDDKLSALDDRMASVRERYVSQFSAMESLVASLKKTEEGLSNMMDSWRGMMNN